MMPIEEVFLQQIFKRPRIAENERMIAVYDAYPVNEGHVLIFAKSERSELFDLDKRDWADLREMLHWVREFLIREHSPDGFNIGANCGEVAGQTIHRFHLHVIPRYVENPRGGIRNFKPALVEF